jgi:flagellin-like hook-associated protein FlgL
MDSAVQDDLIDRTHGLHKRVSDQNNNCYKQTENLPASDDHTRNADLTTEIMPQIRLLAKYRHITH